MIIDKVLSVVAPHDCLVCGREGVVLCTWCQDEAFAPLPSRCYKCQRSTEYSAVCTNCRRTTKLKHLWVQGDYQAHAKQLVSKLKFERAGRASSKVIADLLDLAVPYLPSETIVTFVPTASVRKRQRGYDHGELIAKAFAAKRHLVFASLLIRLGQSRQVGSKRADRVQQLARSIEPKNKYLIQRSQILLIDDVLTTGATMEQAALVLKKSGAKEVNGAVFAQAR